VSLWLLLTASLAAAAPLPAELDAWQTGLRASLLTRTAAGATGQDLAVLLRDPAYRLDLARAELGHVVRPEDFAELRKLPGAERFLAWLLGDADLLEGLLASGPVDNLARSVYTLYCLYQSDPDLALPPENDPPPGPPSAATGAPLTACPHWLRHLALGFALLQQGAYEPGAMATGSLVARYRFYRRMVSSGQMHPLFFGLEPWELRWTIDLRSTDDVEFIVSQRCSRRWDYGGACWECPYIGDNQFGDSIQGPLYHMPWRHAVREAEIWKRTGGVCGTLSTYGSRSANLHGVPSRTAGQPGHCAYAIRFERGRWDVAYSVDWPTSLGTFWGGSWTHMALMEEVFGRDAAQLRALQHTWQAHLFAPRVSWSDPHYAFYAVASRAFPDLAKLTPTREGTLSGFAVGSLASNPTGFAAVLTGRLRVSRDGKLRFRIGADDGARLFIDDQPVVDTAQQPTAVRELTAGVHAYRIEYHDIGGGRSLDIAVEPNGPARGEVRAYEQALAVHPQHYSVWREYASRLRTSETVTAATWTTLAERFAQALVGHQEAAWHWLLDYPAPALAKESYEARRDWLLAMHRILRQDAAPRFEGYPYEHVLNRQADFLRPDKAGLVAFVQQVLPLHCGKGIDYANRLMGWAKGRLGNDAGAVVQLTGALATAFQASGRPASEVRGWCEQAVLAAEQAEDPKAYAQANDLAAQLLKLDPVAERYLNADQARAWPALVAFPGKLVSADGVLKVSSASSDKPLLHRALLRDGPGGGFFHTGDEKQPWALVILPGPARLSGVVLVNRYEACQDRQVPLKVAVSEDNKKWSEVALLDKVETVWRIDLSADTPRAKYVRLSVDNGDKPRPFHLRNVLVYGQPLY